jgi:hypothetical protein
LSCCCNQTNEGTSCLRMIRTRRSPTPTSRHRRGRNLAVVITQVAAATSLY